MKMRVFAAVVVAFPLAFGTPRLIAQGNSDVHVPDSSIEKPGEHGQKAHTNHVIALRGRKADSTADASDANSDAKSDVKPDKGNGHNPPPPPPPPPPPADPPGMSPNKIRAAYGGLPATGGSGIIAIVDAYHYATALNDFNKFSTQFGLPTETSTNVLSGTNKVFQVVYANNTKPSVNCGWGQEAALDIEWAHAMAPNAKIVLVEAASNSFSNLFHAIDVANGLFKGVANAQVSMSWGGGEFTGEDTYDSHFNTILPVTYLAASGDTGGKTIYPGTSPLVVAAGGTTLTLDQNGDFVSETAWSGGGGGPSSVERIPGYQSSIPELVTLLNGARGVPDFSFDADPNTGVAVYDSTSCQGLVGWMVFGGTSVSSPSLAGIVNLAGQTLGHDELTTIYQNFYNGGFYGSPSFRDITDGSNGYSATPRWDFATGVGSNLGPTGK